MSANPPLSPRDRRLDEVVASLSAHARLREVIRLVETWAAAGTPTARARYEEARAFYQLRLMDRAMARAREVAEAAPEDAAAQYLLAEIYIERGWPSHARKIAQALREAPRGAALDLDGLTARAQADPVRLSSQAAAIEAEGEPARVQQLAEYFLTTGSYFRARSLLERLRRVRPDDRRVLDLLWGLDGQFTDKERGLEALLEECAALLPAPAVAPAVIPQPVARSGELPREAERTEAEGEHTESRRLAEAPEGEGGEVASFPALFKHTARAGGPGGQDDGDRTAAFSLASRQEMAAGIGEDTDPGVQAVAPVRVSRVEDTQIMLVLRPGEKQGGARPLHVRREDEAAHNNLRETLNLREWQQTMGVLPADPRPEERPAKQPDRRPDPSDLDRSDLERGPEEEENVVVVKRAAPEPAPAEPSGLRKRPIEVIEKIPLPPPPPPTPAPTPVTAESDPEPEPTGDHPVQPPAPDLKALTRVLLAIGALMFMGMAALLALALYLQR